MTILASLFNLAGPDLLVILFLFPLMMALPIWMIVDCVTKEPSEGNSKIVWLLVILLAPFGSLIYLFARKLQRPSLPGPGPGTTIQ